MVARQLPLSVHFHSISIPTYIASINRSTYLHFIYFQLTPNSFHPLSQQQHIHLITFHSIQIVSSSHSCLLLSYSLFIHSYRTHTHYPLCSHLTLTHTACNNTIVIIANTLISPRVTSNFSYCSSPFQLSYTTFTLPPNFSHLLFPLFTYGPYLVISIIPTFLSSTPLSYVWPIPYYLNRFYFYDLHTLPPYLIFVQLLPVFTRNMMQIVSILHHTYSTRI